ncbi:MAG: Methylated-DNA--protein-cysteine methyltransferase, inducible [Bacteroidota bacterium]|jgi:methylated-DNA-[protein]-cysteine S-methyltransferase
MDIAIQYHQTPIGELIIGSYNNQICLCDWRYRKMRHTIDQRIQQQLGSSYTASPSNAIQQTIQQLNEYFQHQRQQFVLPLLLVGSPFQQSVWQALQQIPYGHTESYLNLSKRLHNPLAIRAVASANGANAIAIIIPCHRIIGHNGDLVGYAGGLPAKKKLLTLENPQAQQPELNLFG